MNRQRVFKKNSNRTSVREQLRAVRKEIINYLTGNSIGELLKTDLSSLSDGTP